MTTSARDTSGGLAVIILAAGAGTRMKSKLPKPLHLVAGLPMISHVIKAAEALPPARLVIVASKELAAAIAEDHEFSETTVVVQDPPAGTGDAVLVGLNAVSNYRTALVVYADHPLVATDDLQKLLDEFYQSQAVIGLLTCEVDDAAGYGRIERDGVGNPISIVERIADDPSKRTGCTEINSGIQVLDVEWAYRALTELPPNPIKNEIFLTDLVEKAAREAPGSPAVIAVTGSPETLLGVNDRCELAVADEHIRRRIKNDLMRAGVTIIGPETVFVDSAVTIGADTTIHPFSIVNVGSTIGNGCVIGPNATVAQSTIGDGTHIVYSIVSNSRIGNNCHVGPWSHLRAGTVVEDDVHIGNFVESKNTHFAPGVRAGHVTYLGDASIGESTNIGAGTVTCNFDGVEKHRTEIGANVFIGSDSMLIAPLSIGDGASTGAGSVVTKDVAPGAKVVGIPARPINHRKSSSEARGSGGES